MISLTCPKGGLKHIHLTLFLHYRICPQMQTTAIVLFHYVFQTINKKVNFPIFFSENKCDTFVDLCNEVIPDEGDTNSSWTVPLDHVGVDKCSSNGVVHLHPEMGGPNPITSVLVQMMLKQPEYSSFHISDSNMANGYGK